MKTKFLLPTIFSYCFILCATTFCGFNVYAQCANTGYFSVTQLYPVGAVTYSQPVTLKAEYILPYDGAGAYGEFRWYTASNGYSSPVMVSDVDYYTTLQSLFTVDATTTANEVRVSYFNKLTECESEMSSYTVQVETASETGAYVSQVSAKKCGSETAKIQVSSNKTGVTFELYWQTPSGSYTYLQSNSSGYFEVDDVYLYGIDNLFVKLSQSSVYYQLSVHSDDAAEPYVSGATTYCFGTGTTLTAAGTGTFKWYDQNNTLISSSASLPIPANQPPGSYGYAVQRTSTGGCQTPLSNVGVLINPRPLDGSIGATASSIFLGQSVQIQSSGGEGAPHYWCSSNGGTSWNVFENAYVGQDWFNFTPPYPGTYRFHLRNKTECGFCWDAGNNGCPTYPYIDVIVYPPATPPTISGATNVIAYSNIPVTLEGNIHEGSGSIQSVSWTQITSKPTSSVVGANTSKITLTPLETGVYLYELVVTDIYGLTAALQVTVDVQIPNNYNYVKETVLLVPAMTEAGLPHATKTEKSVSTTYFDGLGRQMQTVSYQASPAGLDIVQPLVYDDYGKLTKQYLPIAFGNSGWYKLNSEILKEDGDYFVSFYRDGGLVPADTRPFLETEYESSSLSRPVKQYGAGASWKTNNKAVTNSYLVNKNGTGADEEKVIAWKVDGVGMPMRRDTVKGFILPGGYYDTGQLSVKVSADEQGIIVREYTDKSGKLILKKVQAIKAASLSNRLHWAQTYYIYDDFDNLRVVLQPVLSQSLAAYDDGVNSVPSINQMSSYAFIYKYDFRKRLIEKTVPGASAEYIVYDDRDRIVMTQSGNQRGMLYWTFTKYDHLNRVIATGIHGTLAADGQLTQAAMQQRVNDYYKSLGTNGGAWFETFIGNVAGNIHGYSNKSYPVLTSYPNLIDPFSYLTINYYDNYSFKSSLSGDFDYTDESLSQTVNGEVYTQPFTEFASTIGFLTGTKTKVLDGGVTGGYTFLNSINYFDNKGRVIQSVSDNYKGGFDRITNLYDFTGKILKMKSSHSEYDMTWQELVNTRLAGNKLISTLTSNGFGNCGAASIEMLAAGTDGWVETRGGSNLQGDRVIGFANTNPDADYLSIDYALRIRRTSQYIVTEGGVSKFTGTGYSPDDIFKVERLGTQIRYSRNGSVFYETSGVSTNAMLVDVAQSNVGDFLSGIRASFCMKSNTIIRSFEYDHAGRLIKTFHKVGTNPEILLSKNEYNELGQLIDKKLHSTLASAIDAKQSVDYRYNIRGWLNSINNATVSNDVGITNDDDNDLFGMSLHYNDLLGGVTGSADRQFNGNISAVAWSSDMALGNLKSRAYKFAYDPMNRLNSAFYSTLTTTGTNSSSFHESGITYDLNGNILSLQRKDLHGITMDDLSYTYSGNKLTRVSDAADDTKGFKEVNTSVADYAYDSNGSIVRDANKTSDDLVSNAQLNGSTGWNQSGASARATFANNNLTLASGAEIFTLSQTIPLNLDRLYIVSINITSTSSGAITVKLGNASQQISGSGEKSFALTTIDLSALSLNFSADFVGTVETISVFSIAIVTYNYMNLPETVVKGGAESMRYIYDAWGRKLSQDVYSSNSARIKRSDYAGEFFYENDTLKFINHEEGRVVMTGATPEYQYNLKDHLGNVRLTFTTKEEVDATKATFEAANSSSERNQFEHYDEAVTVDHVVFDHTNDQTTSASNIAQRLLGGNTNRKFGLSKSISVMPGDKVNMEVFAKYFDGNANALAAGDVKEFLSQYVNSNGAGTVIDGGAAGSIGAAAMPFASLLARSNVDPARPKVFITWLVFDRNFNFKVNESGFDQIEVSAKENGTNVAHDLMRRVEPLLIKEPGYVYIYLSNENETAVEVYFDDFKVEHIKSPVVQQDDYYPFGLSFNSYSRETSARNNYLYNGKELQDELNLGWYDYQARQYDPAIARWMSIDPLSDLSRRWSPYSYCYNNPLLFIDPDGMFGEYYDQKGNRLGTDGIDDGKIYVVTDKKEAKAISTTDKAGRTTQTGDVSSEIQLPSAGVRSKMGDAVARSLAPNESVGDTKGGFHEEGGIFGTDADGNERVIDAQPGQVAIPGQDDYASIDVFSGETADNALSSIEGTFHTHPSGTTIEGSFSQSPSDFIDKKTGERIGDIPAAQSQSDPSSSRYVSGNHYVLGTGNNTVTIYNGSNPKVATFPLTKFTTIGITK